MSSLKNDIYTKDNSNNVKDDVIPSNTTIATNNNNKTTMRAVQGKDYGDIDETISVQDDISIPHLDDIPPKKRKNCIVVRTLAVALAPGDCRVLSGKTRRFQGPPSFPYIPGGDCCGVVVEMDDETKADVPFNVGDIVAARFVEGPRGALAEYAVVHVGMCDRLPTTNMDQKESENECITPEGAAALVSSGTPALLIADRIRPGERVLIFGAGGGVGSHLCQLVKNTRAASYLVGVTRGDPERLKKLGCDDVIDYTQIDAWTKQEWIDNPFDVIVDLAGGGWPRILEGVKSGNGLIIKPGKDGGRFLTTTPDEPIFELSTVWGILKLFLFTSLWRATYTRSTHRTKLPKYTFAMSLPVDRKVVTRTFKLASEGKLVPCIDPQGPFPFTTDGVRRAFRLQESRHAQGKVVIKVAEK